MRCSKCWLWKKGCLDVGHRDGVDCAAIGDRTCRAMRAIMKLAKFRGVACPPSNAIKRKCVCATIGGTIELSMAKCAECLARWATR